MSADRGNWEPGKLWSLWDLINYQVGPLAALLRTLFEESVTIEDKSRIRDMVSVAERSPPPLPGQPPHPIIPERLYKITPVDLTRIKGALDLAQHIIRQMLLDGAESRLHRFRMFLADKPVPERIKLESLLAEVNALRDAIEDDCKYKRLFLYPDDKGLLVLRVPGDWQSALGGFPAITKDAHAATDCFALSHHTACVFYLMRAAEIGLRAIAVERSVKLAKGKSLEWAQWGEIYGKIDEARADITKNKPAGAGKDAALAFYSGALGHLAAFKDQYRNAVSHVRKDYEEWEAQIALNHVRDFMNGLPPLITETTRRPINWKF